MGQSNFLEFNPHQLNQETDIAFAGDTQTTGGLGRGQIIPSLWLNKILRQSNVSTYALNQMLALKGYNVSDLDSATLITVYGNIQTSADVRGSLFSQAYSINPVFNAAVTTGFYMLLTGPVTASTLVNVSNGDEICFVLDNPSGFSFAWPANVIGGGTVIAGVNIQKFKVLPNLLAHVLIPISNS